MIIADSPDVLSCLIYFSVMPRGSDHSYIVKKRYSQFFELNSSIAKSIDALAPDGLQFPFVDSRYKVFKPSDEERREMINAWLIEILYDSKFMLDSTIFHKFSEFINFFDNIVVDDIIRRVSVPTLFR